MSIDQKLKDKIDDWIKKTGRNQFGDPAGTMYPGGNPLFDERTSTGPVDRYEYILSKNPDLKKDDVQ